MSFKFIAFFIGIFGVLLTTIYSSRLLIYVFHGQNRSDEKVFAHIHESPLIMVLPLVILAFFLFFSVCIFTFICWISLESIWSKFIFVNSETNQIYSLGNVPNYNQKITFDL